VWKNETLELINITVTMASLQCSFSQYFPEAVSNKYKWITDPFHVDSLCNYDFALWKKKSVLALYLRLLYVSLS
jgi:hypothetical protein